MIVTVWVCVSVWVCECVSVCVCICVCECQSNGSVTYGDDIKLVTPHKLGNIFKGVSTFV